MRILIAADIFPPQSGGPATYSVVIANELTKAGEDVRIVSLNPKSDRNAVISKIDVVKNKNKLLKYLEYTYLLIKNAKKADIIYAMGPVNAGLPALIASKLTGKKLVIKVVGDYAWEQKQISDFRFQTRPTRFATRSGRVSDFVSVDEFQKDGKYPRKIAFLRWIEKMVARNSEVVIVPSKYLESIVLGWGVKNKNVRVIYNASELIKFQPVEKPSNQRWIVSAGRLVPWKGMKELIEIMPDIIKEFPDARLKIFGDGPEMKNLQAKVVELKMEKFVDLPGNLAREELLRHIKSADVFVLNSAYEGLSHLLIEAMQCGVPFLASQVGGNPELVEGYGKSDLFELNNKEEIKEKIFKIFTGTPYIWYRNEQTSPLKEFSVGEMVKSTREVLENIRGNN